MKTRTLPGQRFEGAGLLAIEPQALFMLFAPPSSRENASFGNVEVVDISGPLRQRDCGWSDSYEAIEARVQAACDGPSRALVLLIDSPGGEAAGAVESARAVRAKCLAAGKPLFAYVENKACSAAYVYAAAAERIGLAPTALVGSIGVIAERRDYSERNAREGIGYAIVASGKRKADGHPDLPVSEGELAAMKAIVDGTAAVFYDAIAELRPALTAEALKSLEAGTFLGADAMSVGLVDAVESFDQLLAVAAGKQNGDEDMPTAYQKARAALEEAAKIDDANGKAAKRALAAMDDSEPADDKPADDDAAAEDESGSPEDKPAAAKSAAARTPSVNASSAATLADTVQTMARDLATLKAQNEAAERATLYASRPDLSPELRSALDKLSLDDARSTIAAIKPPTVPAPAAAAAPAVRPTVGAGHGASAPSASSSEIDLAMGFVQRKRGPRIVGNSLVVGSYLPGDDGKPVTAAELAASELAAQQQQSSAQ